MGLDINKVLKAGTNLNDQQQKNFNKTNIYPKSINFVLDSRVIKENDNTCFPY